MEAVEILDAWTTLSLIQSQLEEHRITLRRVTPAPTALSSATRHS